MAERRRKPDYVHGNRTWENTEGYFKHKNEGSKEMNQNETQWDKLLKIKTTGRMTLIQISIDILMNQRLIWYWSAWQTVD